MDRRVALTLFATTALCLGLVSPTSAQTLKDQLIGTWTLVSNVEKYQDGTERSTFGPQGKGLLILDRTGWFSFQLIGGDRPKQTGRPDNPIGPAVKFEARIKEFVESLPIWPTSGTAVFAGSVPENYDRYLQGHILHAENDHRYYLLKDN